jgi:hypothetical protein
LQCIEPRWYFPLVEWRCADFVRIGLDRHVVTNNRSGSINPDEKSMVDQDHTLVVIGNMITFATLIPLLIQRVTQVLGS